MFTSDLILWLLSYGLGLCLTAIDRWWGVVSVPAIGVAILAWVCAAIVPRLWLGSPRSGSWIIAGAIVVLATINYHWQTPRPGDQDISRVLPGSEQSSLSVTVEGQIRSIPGVTASDRVKFELAVSQIAIGDQGQAASGCLYVTVPLLQGTGLRPHQTIAVTGRGYKPRPANNPAGFDFQQYLARNGCFAGFSGRTVSLSTSANAATSPTSATSDPKSPFPWWRIRQKVIQAQVRALGSPEGTLVSAMVLGSGAVDLPSQLREDFARVGLAHTLAASGFQVTLLMGCVLWLTQGRSSWIQCGSGFLVLLVLLGLTGPQPSIVRAVIMGSVGLVGIALKRRTKPLGLLILAGTILLLLRPLWIWDLGFQLSFLATFGLVTTATPLSQKLSWIPPRLAELLAVPIAAMIWTIPILLYQFGVLSPFSLLVNPLTTPLVTVISLGGILSSVGAVCFAPVGQFLALLLSPVVKAVLAIVHFFLVIPGTTVAVGSISVVQLVLLYGLFIFLWLYRFQRFPALRWVGVAIAVTIALVPNWWSQQKLSQLTIVAGARPPVLILQDQGQAAVLNSGGEAIVRYTLRPFLQQQGINRLAWATQSQETPDNRDGWLRLWQHIQIDRFGQLPSSASPDLPPWQQWSIQALNTALSQQAATIVPFTCNHSNHSTCSPSLELGRWQLTPLQGNGSLWQIQDRLNAPDSPGFALLQTTAQDALLTDLKTSTTSNSKPWLWWTGESLKPQLLDAVNWQRAIASANKLDPATIQAFRDRNIPLYWTGRDGALQWQPGRSIQTTFGLSD